MTQRGKLAVCLAVMAGLALLAWRTMQPGRMQQFTWLALGFFAFRIVMSAVRTRYDERQAAASTDVGEDAARKG